MRNAMVLVTVVLYTISAIHYVRMTWKGIVTPVPATWILMQVVFSLSIWMYWKSPHHSFTGNIGNVAGFINVCIIFLGVIGFHLKKKSFKVAFDDFQKICLVSGAIITIFWLFTNNSSKAYLLTQGLAILAYVPTVVRLSTAKKNTESFFLWCTVLLACLIALYPAIILQDKLAWIYLGRAIPSGMLIIILMIRLQIRK